MRQHFIFKGGTSLSKGWKLIERFSEDIDIALAPKAFGREYRKSPSNSYVKTLKKEGCAYTTNSIKDALQEQLAAMGVPGGLITIDAEDVNTVMPDKDPQTLFVRYPSLYDQNLYIAEAVKVEFGVRSLKEPFAEVPVQSIIAEVFLFPEKPSVCYPIGGIFLFSPFYSFRIHFSLGFLLGRLNISRYSKIPLPHVGQFIIFNHETPNSANPILYLLRQ